MTSCTCAWRPSRTRSATDSQACRGPLSPTSGQSHAIRSVITLGPAVLLLDGAVVLAFAPGGLSEARRAAAALPLIALAVVPSTLLRPQFPYLQGLFLFVLLVAFIWGERAHLHGRPAALVVLGVAGLAGAVIAPGLDVHRPWLNYRAWTGTLARAHRRPVRLEPELRATALAPDRPPRPHGHRAARRLLEGRGSRCVRRAGLASGGAASAPLPAPAASAVATWSQTIRVNLAGMPARRSSRPAMPRRRPSLPGVRPGAGPGTWVSDRPLTTGSSYSVRTYSPHPSAAELSGAGTRYPDASLAVYRRMALPEANEPVGLYPQLSVRALPFSSADWRPVGRP